MKSIGVIIITICISVISLQYLVLPINSLASNQTNRSVLENNENSGEPVIINETVYIDNWFNFVNEFFEKYTTAKVIDVYTLISYEVKRVGGYNHADVEPISAADTQKMLNIYGGVWSWNRRPVWVLYNGRYMAASINGYPHSYDLVSGNNMTGHTCIHFYMSRTHGTNNLDSSHQAAVNTAFNNEAKLNTYLNS